MANILPTERIERSILLIRGHKVIVDADLAELYGVETRALLQAVSRNQKRFPEDFMFQMSKEEHDLLRSQIVISKKGRGRLNMVTSSGRDMFWNGSLREIYKGAVC